MKKNSEILDWVLNRQNYKYLTFIFRSMQVGVASVTVKKKVTLTFIINGVQVFACQPLSTHNCAVKKHHQETQNGYLAPNIRKRLNLFSYIPRWPPIANTFPVIITGHQQSFVLFRPGPWVSHFIPTWTVEADKKMNLKV